MKQKDLINTVNKIYKNQKITFSDLENFITQLKIFTSKIDENETEEHIKYLLRDFLKNTFYFDNAVNTKGRFDFAIHLDKTDKSKVGVIIETKAPSSKKEMISQDNLQAKSMYQCLLYYLQERINNENNDLKHIIITNFYEWFIFDATDFEKLFYENNELKKEFENWNSKKKTSQTTNLFYNEIAPKYIKQVETHSSASLQYTYFDIKDVNANIKNVKTHIDKTKMETHCRASLQLYKIFSPEFLLKKSFTNDSNTLDNKFYYELLYIIGLEEQKKGGKKIINRKKEKQNGSLIENTISIIKTEGRLQFVEKPEQYGKTEEEQIENIALQLSIMWINRIIFLKLLEAQLITYHNSNLDYKFLTINVVKDYDELNELFFDILAKKINERPSYLEKFKNLPYLNSSLFEISKLENQVIRINSLKDRFNLPIFSKTVLKNRPDRFSKPVRSELPVLQYLFNFLDAFDFTSVGSNEIQEEQKNLINASVLGLIFEKINGYKEGSFFTPGYITMYMSRETIRRAVVQKFKTLPKFQTLAKFEELKDKIEDRKQANEIINSLKICDPAVGSGHFLVSALNEIIAIKSELEILEYRNGNKVRDFKIEVINDELVVIDKETDGLFEYNLNKNENIIDYKQNLQETLFHEKQTIIESCLFGVDINPNSVNITRLRLWIELLKNSYYKPVETQGIASPQLELQTLPNIDINIKQGNSLVGRFALNGNGVRTHGSASLQKMQLATEKYKEQVIIYKSTSDKITKQNAEKEILKIKQQFAKNVNPTDKDYILLQNKKVKLVEMPIFFTQADKDKWKIKTEKLTSEIVELEQKYDKKLQTLYENAFEWRFEFPEVLDENGNFKGFDIIIGNPPYISIKEIENVQKRYLSNFFETAKGQYDLYTLFIEKSYNLLNDNGLFSMITSNTYYTNKSLTGIRKFLLKNTQLIKIINLDESVFLEARLDVGITLFSKNKTNDDYKINIVPSKEYFDNENSYELQKSNFENSENNIFTINIRPFDAELLKNIKRNTIQLGDISNINRGIEFGSNSPEIKNKKFKNSFPLIVGNCIEKYRIKKFTGYAKFIENDKSNYKDFKLYSSPRILVQRIRNLSLKTRIVSTFTTDTILCTNTLRVITLTSNDFDYRYILGLLNSNLINYYFSKNFLNKDIYAYQLSTIPIKKVSKKEQNKIIELVIKLEKLQKKDDNNLIENKINKIVYKLYGLTKKEIKIVEGKNGK